MSVQFNHTIVWCRDKQKSATFLVELLGLPSPRPFGAMLIVQLTNGVSLDCYENEGEIASQHYAFLVGEDEFHQVFARIRNRRGPALARPRKAAPARNLLAQRWQGPIFR